MNAASQPSAAAAGTLTLGGELKVHRLGFGAMRLTGPDVWGDPIDLPAAHRVLQYAVSLGVNFIDTADSYGPEVSERVIAEALYPYPDDLVIATKAGLTRPSRHSWERKADPAHLRQACEGSLRRLRVSCIDLYQLHAIDPKVPLEDSLGELERLKNEGKIRHIGVSNFSVKELQSAQKIVRIVSVQNRYNINDRVHEPVLKYCEQQGLAFIPWYPLAAGINTKAGAGGELARICAAQHITPAQASLAWLLNQSPAVLPIPGTTSIHHLEENVAAAAVRL